MVVYRLVALRTLVHKARRTARSGDQLPLTAWFATARSAYMVCPNHRSVPVQSFGCLPLGCLTTGRAATAYRPVGRQPTGRTAYMCLLCIPNRPVRRAYATYRAYGYRTVCTHCTPCTPCSSVRILPTSRSVSFLPVGWLPTVRMRTNWSVCISCSTYRLDGTPFVPDSSEGHQPTDREGLPIGRLPTGRLVTYHPIGRTAHRQPQCILYSLVGLQSERSVYTVCPTHR